MHVSPNKSSCSRTSPFILNTSDVQVGCITTTRQMINSDHPHPGNRIFSRIVLKNRPIYRSLQEDATRRKLLAISIVMAIENMGGRFIVKEKGEELSNREAYRITTNALSGDGGTINSARNKKRRAIFQSLVLQAQEGTRNRESNQRVTTEQTFRDDVLIQQKASTASVR